MLKFLLGLIFSFALMATESIDFSLMDHYEFDGYLRNHKRSLQEACPDKLLLKNKRLEFHAEKFENIDDRWVNLFVRRRIADKQGTTYPDMAVDDVSFLCLDSDFIYQFKLYVQGWIRNAVYNEIETRILDLSRLEPDAEYRLGKPTLDPEVRFNNTKFVVDHGLAIDAIYRKCHLYMMYISENHEDSKSFNKSF